jgi:uncharacterized membrane protein YcaP (DUF421 family)
VDLRQILAPTQPILEILIRGTIVYLVLFALLRLLRREAGGLSVGDLLVIVIIADAAQNGMAGGQKSVADCLLLVAVIAAWAWVLDVLAYKFPHLRRILKPQKRPLIKDGRIIRPNLARELITEDELLAQLRMHGLEAVTEVRDAYIESDGRVSVIPINKT